MKKTVLYLIWRNDKRMFMGLCLFVVLQVFFIYKGVETTPFYLYGMYSDPYHHSPSKVSYELSTTDGKPLELAPIILYNLRFLPYQDNQQKSLRQTIEKRTLSIPALSKYFKEQLLQESVSEEQLNSWISQWYFVDSCIIKTKMIDYE
jgi:hypothetical protein